MKRSTLFLALLATAGFANAGAYQYQGTLNDGGKPAEGVYDLQVSVTDRSGTRALAAPLTIFGVNVSKGRFSAEVDFGVDLSQFDEVKLSAAVRQGTGPFQPLGNASSFSTKSTLGGAVCWETNGNSNVQTANLGTNLLTDANLLSLRSRGDEILYLRGTSGGVEQNGSSAVGNNSAAWGSSSAFGANSFTVGRGGTAATGADSFVFADGLAGVFNSSLANQFLVRADGGAMINTTVTPTSNDDFTIGTRPTTGDADADLVMRTRTGKFGRLFLRDTDNAFFLSAQATGANLLETTANGARLTVGGAWTNGSSRLFKEGFVAVDVMDVLGKVMDMPISTWTYKNSSEGTHVGPMAEDFKAAFGLGSDNQHIATVDADGVALAAIQGLNQKLEAENAALKSRLDALEAHLGL